MFLSPDFDGDSETGFDLRVDPFSITNPWNLVLTPTGGGSPTSPRRAKKMMKTIKLRYKEYTFNIEKEQDQIRYALGMTPEMDPFTMKERHWALLDEWACKLHIFHNWPRCEELTKLLIL